MPAPNPGGGRRHDALAGRRLITTRSLKAKEAGEIAPDVDPERLAWEMDSLLGRVNSGFKGGDGAHALERGRRAIHDRLSWAATPMAKPLPNPTTTT